MRHGCKGVVGQMTGVMVGESNRIKRWWGFERSRVEGALG